MEVATLVYRYGVRAHAQLPDEVWEQLRLAHRMRNALVELERDHDQAMRDLWSGRPGVGQLERQLAAAEHQTEELAARAKAEHSADRTTATRPGTAAELRQARAAVTHLRARRRAAISEAYPLVKPRIEQLRAERKSAIKACRQEFAAAGLYWATYNAILAGHATAVRLVDQARRAGQPANLRFRRFDGGGVISVQLQRIAADPPRTPALLASGEGKWRNVLQIRPWMDPAEFDALPRADRRRIGRTGEAVIQLGRGRTVTLPITVHRMLPPEADVCEAQLVVTPVAAHTLAALCVTINVPDPPAAHREPVVALHGGWRQRPDGSLRVGTWASSTPLEVPAHLADVVAMQGNGRWGEIVLPGPWLDVATRTAAIRGRRDTAQEPVQRKLAEWLDAHPQPDPGNGQAPVTAAEVRRWRSAGRLAALAKRWRDQPPVGDGSAEMVAVLEAWRRRDKILWEREANQRHQLTGRRDDAWRRVGAWLADHAGVLVVDDANFADLRRRSDIADDDPALPGQAAQKARARAALAAPGRLRQLTQDAAERRGVTIREITAAHLSRTHRTCGHVGDAHPRYATSAVVACPGCADRYDQDVNAALLMLDRGQSGDAT